MTQKVKELYEQIIADDEAVQKILNDPKYGRGSVVEDFDTTRYLAEKAIKQVKEGYHTAPPTQEPQTEKERATEPIEASKWQVPNSWVYDKNYVYNADDEKYVFLTRELGSVVRPKSWVKNLVQAYSNWDGEEATITEVCMRFGITRGVFNEIKRILGLTHDHEPFTPDEVQTMSSEEMAMEAHQQKRFRTKIEFDKLDWKATQKEAKKWRNLKQSLVEELNAQIPQIQVNPIQVDGGLGGAVPNKIVVETGDWHLGAVARGLPSVPDFNPEILKNYIDQMIWLIRNEYPESEVIVHFMGDSLETVTGLNHPDSWKNIADGYYGAKAILETVELLSYLIQGLKASKFVAVTGNHGRLTSDRKKDHSGEAEILIYNYLKDRLTDVEVKFSEFWTTDLVEGIGHVLEHGHLRLQKGENIVRLWQNTGQQADYIMYKQGHTHNRNIIEDTNLYRHYVVPALFTGSKYNERNGYGNKAGFSINYRHPFTNQVKTEDYTL